MATGNGNGTDLTQYASGPMVAAAGAEVARQATGAAIGGVVGALGSMFMGGKWTGGAQTGAVVGLMITLAASSAMNISAAATIGGEETAQGAAAAARAGIG